MGVPYILAVAAIPKEHYGVYMGVFSTVIVIPMLIDTLTFGFIDSGLLGGNPANAMMFAEVALFAAALLMLWIKTPRREAEAEPPSGGYRPGRGTLIPPHAPDHGRVAVLTPGSTVGHVAVCYRYPHGATSACRLR